MPLARRWPPGRRAVPAGPHPNLAGAASRRGLPCAGTQSGRGGAGQAGEGTERRAGAGPPYRRRASSSPRPRRAARPALLPPAPPALPRLPSRPPPPPPPPAPPRRLIDGSLKKSPRSLAASAGELRHSRAPARRAPARRSAPARTAAAHRAPGPRPRRAPPPGGDPRDPEGRGGRGPSSPAPGRESTPTKKVRAGNEGARQSPTLFLRRWGRGRGGCVANSSQMSSGAEAQGRLCFQSLKSPALPASLFPSAGRCPGRRSQCARFSGRRGGSGGREGGGEGGWL